MVRGRVSERYGQRADASQTVGAILSLVGLVLYTAVLLVFSFLLGSNVLGCDSYPPNGCSDFNVGFNVTVTGVFVTPATVLLCVVLLFLRRRWTWIVIACAAGIVTAGFVVGAIVEFAAVHQLP
jgi:hypothetical protein